MDACCASDDPEIAHDALVMLHTDTSCSQESFDKLNRDFVDLFCKQILANSSVESFKQCLKLHHFTADTVKQNLNLCSIVFDQNDHDYAITNTYSTDQNQMSPFLFAVYKGHIEIVRYLYDNYKPNLETEGSMILDEDSAPVQGVSALWMAVSRNNINLALLLLRYGANINHATKSGSTPLRVACFDNNTPLVEILIQNRADVNLPNKFQNTCLMLASYLGYDKVCQLLIAAGADLDKQALCGATALHFAAAQGNGSVVKLLLKHGAKFQVNNNGFTPLFTAAENTQESIVQQFFDVPNLTTLEERIAACELLGASFATTSDRLDKHNFMLEACTWLQKALWLRYMGNLATEGGCNLQDYKPIARNQMHQTPSIAKTKCLEPISAYNYHKESQNWFELESISHNPTLVLYECFCVLERILGSKSLTVAEALVIRGAEFADIGHFSQSCQLWLRAIQIKINAKVFIGDDCLRFVRVLERMIHERTLYCSYLEQLLQLGIEYYTLRPRLFGYHKLCQGINAGTLEEMLEDFTYNELKRSPMIKYSPNLNLWNKMDSDLDSDQVMLSQLYLCSIVARNIHEYNAETSDRLHKLIHRLCKLNITQNTTGRTLLHLAMCPEPDEDYHYNNRFNNFLIRYPSVITARFLILCGADVTATDIAYNTPLHYLSAFAIRDSEAKTDDQYELFNLMIRSKMSGQVINGGPSSPTNSLSPLSASIDSKLTLATYSRCPPFYGGEYSVHIDAVNIFGKIAKTGTTSVLSDILFNNKQVYSLKCFAARVVHQQYLRCESCHNKTGKFELEKLWTDSSTVPNQRHIKLLRYNQILANAGKSAKGNARFRLPYLDHYCSHNIVDYCQNHVWHVMNYFAQKLSISLELAQFVEMHGPCKFVHFPCVNLPTNLPQIHCSKC